MLFRFAAAVDEASVPGLVCVVGGESGGGICCAIAPAAQIKVQQNRSGSRLTEFKCTNPSGRASPILTLQTAFGPRRLHIVDPTPERNARPCLSFRLRSCHHIGPNCI